MPFTSVLCSTDGPRPKEVRQRLPGLHRTSRGIWGKSPLNSVAPYNIELPSTSEGIWTLPNSPKHLKFRDVLGRLKGVNLDLVPERGVGAPLFWCVDAPLRRILRELVHSGPLHRLQMEQGSWPDLARAQDLPARPKRLADNHGVVTRLGLIALLEEADLT